MNYVLWLIAGGLLGWLTSILMGRSARKGILLKVLIASVGAFLLGLFLTPLFDLTLAPLHTAVWCRACSRNFKSWTLRPPNDGPAARQGLITTQTIALTNEITAVQILGPRMTAAVLLVEALGSGWNVTDLPSAQEVTER